jgi:Trk-type K+ transport system membrane component
MKPLLPPGSRLRRAAGWLRAVSGSAHGLVLVPRQDGAHSAFDEAFLVTFLTGLGLWFAARREKRELKVRDGFLLVVAIWTLLPVFAACLSSCN